MYPFSQSVTPAVRTHMDAQTAFMNDMSKSLFQSFQQMCELNIKLMQTMLEETTLASQQMITADRQTEVLSAAASRAQPAAEKLRAYQQHISRLAADAQVELTRVTEQHVQNTTRTARQLADEVARTATEETERGMRKQQESIQRFTDPFAGGIHTGNGQARQGNGGAAGATMQSATPGQSASGGQPQSGSIQGGNVGRGESSSPGSKGTHA
ncbi:MAG: granule-associated protein [Massilia sp.]|nr:granule-associated protein [Massilia sp.]MDB5791085.1 granule-associated protein [Massilia sp.]